MPQKIEKPAKKKSITKGKEKRPGKPKKAKIFEECLNCKFLEIKGFRKKATKIHRSLPPAVSAYCLNPKALEQLKGARNLLCPPYSSKGETACPHKGPY